MEYNKFHYIRHKIPYGNEVYVLDYKQMDINGDNIPDDIYLVGKRHGFIRGNFADDII